MTFEEAMQGVLAVIFSLALLGIIILIAVKYPVVMLVIGAAALAFFGVSGIVYAVANRKRK